MSTYGGFSTRPISPSLFAKEDTLRIEKDFGRVRNEKWGDRTCDLDLLIYSDVITEDPDCRLPHPGIPDRMFVLAPLAEIAPDLVVPGLGRTVRDLADACPDAHWVRRLEQDPKTAAPRP